MSSTILGIIASGGVAAGGATSYESIATATGTGSSGTITFSSIPSTFKHLQIRGIARDDRALDYDIVKMQFNSDTGSNYAYHTLRGNGTAASAGGGASQTYIYASNTSAGGNTLSDTMGVFIVDILDYASTTKYKTTRGLAGMDQNFTSSGIQEIRVESGLWMSTSAITSISLITGAGNFTTATQVALYGIKEA